MQKIFIHNLKYFNIEFKVSNIWHKRNWDRKFSTTCRKILVCDIKARHVKSFVYMVWKFLISSTKALICNLNDRDV